VYYDEDFLDSAQADELYQDLWKHTAWEKTAKINRWVSLCHELSSTSSDGDENEKENGDDETEEEKGKPKDYKYRDAPGDSVVGFPDAVKVIQRRAEEWYFEKTGGKQRVTFNVCLLNFYENGEQRIGWHSDREEIGRDTPIASVSLGATRTFLVRSKTDGMRDRASMAMKSGSIILMENKCQHDYVHSVPKEVNVTQGRINLTFRCKTTDTEGEGEHERRDNWLENIIDGATPVSEGWSLNNPAEAAVANNNNDTTTTKNYTVFGDRVKRGDLSADRPTIYFLVKTNLGSECYCAAEMGELLSNNDDWDIVAQPLGMDGYVACCGAGGPNGVESSMLATTRADLLNLRAAHHVLQYHTHFDLEELVSDQFPEPKLIDGETLYQYFKKRLVDGSASISTLAELKDGTFRTTCERFGGPHAFRAPEVER
jgi:alkylated DNA repair dioxygenase AlkB